MTLKTIAAFLDETPASAARLEAAIALAEPLSAHVDGIALLDEAPLFYAAGSEMALDLWAQSLRERRSTAKKIADEAAERIAAQGLSAGGRADAAVPAVLAELAALHARTSDISLVGVPTGDTASVLSEILDGALFGSGRPVLAMPAGAAPVQLGKILVAWDAGQAASRAIHDAMDFLEKADAVSLAIVDPTPSSGIYGEEPGADMAAHLARHGVKVTLERLPSLDRSIAETMIGHAGDIGAGMIVMGGYGHSKLREAVFGGVTREMLLTSPVPMFMSH